MIFLSNYRLTYRDNLKMRLYNSNAVHGAVYRLFMANKLQAGRILYADKGFRNGTRQILILSGAMPEVGEFGEISTKTVPERFLEFSAYDFEIVINPVRRNSLSRKLEPVRGKEAILEWFENHSADWGFKTMHLEIGGEWADRFSKSASGEVTLSKANASGVLQVTSHENFVNSFRNGIGRGKAFGCGMLQLRPV